MTGDLVPVLWLYGPPGVGKTAVGWEIYSELVRSGVQTGYVDVDQLGMCYPETAGDPGRHLMQARNLDGVIAGYRAGGASCVVVSGVVDPDRGVPRDELAGVALTTCRLRADDAELTWRFVGRQGGDDGLGQVLREAARLEAGAGADICVDTTGRTVADVVRLVWDRLSGWPGPVDPQPLPPAAGAADTEGALAGMTATEGTAATEGMAGAEDGGSVLWLCGATGVGTSTVGFQIYLKVLGTGLTAAYIDLDQLGFCGPTAAGHRVRAGNLAAVWRTFREAGAQALVLVGPGADGSSLGDYATALSVASLTVCRLHAGRDELTSRIMRRGQGRGSWSQPGDPLIGKPAAHLLGVVDRAVREADALERAGVGLRIDTDRRPVAEIVDTVLARTGWPVRRR